MPLVTSDFLFFRYATPGPQQNFLYPFRWTHSGLFCYYVSVTSLGYIWVYLDPFSPKSVNSDNRVQTALEALLLFWKKISESLDKMGYHRKEYGWCVMNKIVKGKQCTILWHADDLKMLHVDSNVVSHVIADIETEYAKITKSTITEGKINKYLRMNIN